MSRACPDCGAQPRRAARYCPRCGRVLETDGPDPRAGADRAERLVRRHPAIPLVAAVVIALTVAAGAVLLTQRGTTDGQATGPTEMGQPDPLGAIHWTVSSAGTPDRPLVTDLTPVTTADASDDGTSTVVASTGTVLWGIDVGRGTVLWERRLSGRTPHTPVAVHDAVLVTEPTGSASLRLTAVEAATGLPRWSRTIAGDAEVAGAATIALVREGDELEALDAESGDARWRRGVDGTVADVDARHVLVLSDGSRSRLSAHSTSDGAAVWSEEIAPEIPAVEVRAILADAQIVLVGEGDGVVRGLERTTGATRWTTPPMRRGETLEVTPGGLGVFVDRGRRYTSLDVRSGTLAWQADRLIVSPEKLLVGARDAISVTADRQVTGLGLADGATLWQSRLAPVGEVAVVDDHAVLSDGDGRLVGVGVSDRQQAWETWLPHVGRDVLVVTGDGRLLRAATTRANLTLYEPTTGTVRWSQRVGTGATTAPQAAGGLIVLRRALDRPDPDHPSGIAITALDESDGTVVWEVPGADVERPAWLPAIHPASVQWLATIPPTIAGDLVVEVAGPALRAYATADGELRWESEEAHAAATAPAITDDLVIVGDVTGDVVALDRTTGEPRWTTTLDGPITTAPTAAGDALIAVTADGDVHGLDVSTGDERWHARLDGPARYPPLVSDSRVVLVGRDVVGLDARDGTERWRRATQAPIAGGPSRGGGAVHITTTDGGVIVLDLDDGGTIGHFLVPDPIGGGPLVLDDRTYVLTLRGEIHAIGLRDAESELWPLPPIDGRR